MQFIFICSAILELWKHYLYIINYLSFLLNPIRNAEKRKLLGGINVDSVTYRDFKQIYFKCLRKC